MKGIIPPTIGSRLCFYLLLFLTAYSQPACALYWLTNGANTNWDSSSLNWATNSGGTPVAWTNNDVAIFGDATGGTINLQQAITANYLLFSNSGTWTLASATNYTITATNNGTPTPGILYLSNSTTTVNIGTNVTIQGGNANSIIRGLGTLNVAGTISGMAASGQNLTVGYMGNLNVTNGGLLFAYQSVVLGSETGRTSVINVNGGTIQAGETLGTPPSSANIVLANISNSTTTLNINSGLVMTKKTDGALTNSTTVNALRFGPTSASTNSTGTVNLNGGTLAVARIYEGNTSVSSTFNFNGGTLRVSDYINTNQAAIFMEGIDSAWVLAGGAKIDTGTNSATSVTIKQLLQSGAVSDGGLTKLGAGTLTLATNNTYNGRTTVNAGTLALGTDNALASTNAVTVNGSTAVLGISTFNETVGSVTLTDGSITGTTGVLTGSGYTVQNGSISAILAGTGAALTKSGSGTVTLSGTNTYTGATTLQDGVVNFASLSNLGAGSSIVFDGGGLQYAAGNTVDISTRTLTFNAGGGTIDTGSNSITLANAIGNSGSGGLTKAGTGTLTLTAANTYSGATTLQGGVVNFASLSNLGTGGSIVFNGGGLQYAAGNTVDISTRALTFNAGGGTIDTSSNNITLANAIGNSGAGGLTKAGTGTLTLTAGNSYTGSTVVGAGVMNIQNGSALGTGSAGVTVSNAATLQLQGGITVTGKSLSIAGEGVGSAGALQSVSGNNTWSGDMAVNTAAQARIESTAGTLTLDGTTTLTGTSANGLIFQGAGTIVVNGKITGNGKVTRGGTPGGGTLSLNGANDYTGGTLITRDSYINIGNDSAFGTGAVGVNATGVYLSATGGTRTLANNFSLGATGTTFTGSNNITINGSFTGYSSSSRISNTMGSGTTLTLAGNVYLTSADNSRTLTFGSSTTNGSAGTTILISGNIANNSSANTLASNLGASGGGTVILSGSNTYTGTTQLGNGAGETGGILQVGNGGTAGNLGAGAVTLNAGTLVFKRSDEMTVANAISGAGGVTQSGAGKTILSGSNNYTGQTTVESGTLQINSASAAGTGTITQTGSNSTLEINTTGTVANAMSIYNIKTLQTVTLSGNKTLNNATYDVASGTITTDSGNLTGTGGVTKQGAGTLILTGNNGYTGAVAVNEGLLDLNSATGGAAASAGTVSVASGATLLVSQSNQVNNAAAVTLSGGTIQRGSGVSEVFGNLNLTTGSFLDFGTGATGTMSFGAYSPSLLLTVQNFIPGNTLTFKSDLTDTINNGSLFAFSGGFTSTWSGGTFTITAIPEPSSVLAVAGLLALVSASALKTRRTHKSA